MAKKVVPVSKGVRPHPNARKRRDDCFAEQNGQCFYCRVRMTRARGLPTTATLEHRVPLSRGGTHSRKNLVAACAACNYLKGNKTEDEFAPLLAALPYGKIAVAGMP